MSATQPSLPPSVMELQSKRNEALATWSAALAGFKPDSEKAEAAYYSADEALDVAYAEWLATLPAAANDNSLFLNPALWADKALPEREWYVPDLIPSRTVTLLSGDGGLGKSLLALQLAVASAVGGSTMGLEPLDGPVIYIGAEDEADEFHRRIDGILRSIGGTYEQLDGLFKLLPLADQDATMALPDKSGRMVPTKLFEIVHAEVVRTRPAIVVLDTSADLFGGDEIKRTQVRQFVALLRQLAMEGDCAVLLLSHPSVAGMQTGTGTSGSTAWNNSVRSRLYLTAATGDDADPDGRVLTTMKANYGRKGDALNLRWQEGVFVPDDGTHKNMASGILNKGDDGLFVELLRKLVRQGTNVSPTPCQTYGPKLMAGMAEGRGVPKKRFEAAMRRLLENNTIKIVEDGPPSKRRKRLWVTSDDYGAV